MSNPQAKNVILFRTGNRNFSLDLAPELQQAGYEVTTLDNLDDYIASPARLRPFLAVLEIGSATDLERAQVVFDWTELMQPEAPARFLLLLGSKNIPLGEHTHRFAGAEIAYLPQPARNLVFKLELQQKLLATQKPATRRHGFSVHREERIETGDRLRPRVLVLRGPNDTAGSWQKAEPSPSGKVRWRWVKSAQAVGGPPADAYSWLVQSAAIPRFETKTGQWLLEKETDDLICMHGEKELYSSQKSIEREEALNSANLTAKSWNAPRAEPNVSPGRDAAPLESAPATGERETTPPAAAPTTRRTGAAEAAAPAQKTNSAPSPVTETSRKSTPQDSTYVPPAPPAWKKHDLRPEQRPVDPPLSAKNAPTHEAIPPVVEAPASAPPPGELKAREANPAAGAEPRPNPSEPDKASGSHSTSPGTSAPASASESARAPTGETPGPTAVSSRPTAPGITPATSLPESGRVGAMDPSAAKPAPPSSAPAPNAPAFSSSATERAPLPSLGEALPEVNAPPLSASEDPRAVAARPTGSAAEPPLPGNSTPTPQPAPAATPVNAAARGANPPADEKVPPPGATPPLLETEHHFGASPIGENAASTSVEKPPLSVGEQTRIAAGPAENTNAPQTVTGVTLRQNEETQTVSGGETQDPRHFLKNRYFVLMTLEELGDQESSWHPTGRYRIYLSAQHRYFGLKEPAHALPLWVYEGELAPEFIEQPPSWKFYDRPPVRVTTLESLPPELLDHVYRLAGLTPPSEYSASTPGALRPDEKERGPTAGVEAPTGAWGRIKRAVRRMLGR